MDLDEADRLRLNGDYAAALDLYEEVLSLTPDRPRARHGRAVCWIFGEGWFREAVDELERLLDDCPTYDAARWDLFKTYVMLGEYEPARTHADWLLGGDPRDRPAEVGATVDNRPAPGPWCESEVSYWSRKPGLELVYSVHAGPYTTLRARLGSLTQPDHWGTPAYPLHLWAGGRHMATEWLLPRASGPAWVGVDLFNDAGAVANAVRVMDALPLATRWLRPGETAEVHGAALSFEPTRAPELETLDATLLYHGEERLDLPAGVLECGRFEQILQRDGHPRQRVTRWYAHGLGLARLLTAGGEDWRLVSVA